MNEEKEPVMDCVYEAGGDSKNISLCAGILRSLIERVERLEEEKKKILSDIRDVFIEAKNRGYDPKIMRIIIKMRKKKAVDRDEEEYLINAYRKAVGL